MTRVLGTRSFGRSAAAVALALGVALPAACADEGDAPDPADLASGELEGWTEVESYAGTETHEYDQVAAAPAPAGPVWFTRDGGSDDLAVWTVSGGQVGAAAVETPAGVSIPVAVAADGGGWTAVAVSRDRPDGTNTGLLVWRLPGVASQEARPESLSVARGVPTSVTAGRTEGISLVAGLVDSTVSTWVSRGGGWTAGEPDLGIGPVASVRVTGTEAGFALAAVARDGTPHLWTSPDGLSWSRVDVSDPGASLAAVAMLAPLGPEFVVAWLPGAVADEAPRDATEVLVQQVAGTEVTDLGTLAADPDDDIERIDLNGAARRGEWVLVAGTAIAADGSVRPGLWAGAGGDWGLSAQDDLVDQPGQEFRTLAASDDGHLHGLLTERGGVDVELWRAPGPDA